MSCTKPSQQCHLRVCNRFVTVCNLGAGGPNRLYSNFEARPGAKRAATQPVGAVSYEPYGRRFTITDGNKVSWLGWSLYIGYLPHYGPRYMDVRFKGERIAYEISMQEALACEWQAKPMVA